mmetsp:Transcript_1121/g.2400  ORF Transcript_1121/g.2400 Transcript_1121/m.2400 type:complete len:571 (-) Transcript_1121:113-1825(-)
MSSRCDEAIALIREAQENLKDLNKLNTAISIWKNVEEADRRSVVSALLPCFRVVKKKVSLIKDEASVQKISQWMLVRVEEVLKVCLKEAEEATVLLSQEETEESQRNDLLLLSVFYFRASLQCLLSKVSFRGGSLDDVHSQMMDSDGEFVKTIRIALCNSDLPAVGKGFIEEDVFPYKDMMHYVANAVGKLVLQQEEKNSAMKKKGNKRAKKAKKQKGKTKAEDVERADNPTSGSGVDEQNASQSVASLPLSFEAASAVLLAITRHYKTTHADNMAVLHNFAAQHKILALLSDELIKKTLSRAWVSLFAIELPSDIVKELLLALQEEIIPAMRESDALRISDFLTSAYDNGGLLAVLALSSLFHLMSKYNLDYPRFFPKLYNVMDAESFFLKHRKRLITMASHFLKSSLLPGALATGFIKKMAFNTLHTPSHIAMVFAPIMHNLVRRHPLARTLFHAEDDKESGMFSYDEIEPSKSGADNTSVFEISLLREHYLPHVRKSMDALSQKPSEEQDLLTIDSNEVGYSRLFEEESRRKFGKGAVSFKCQDSLFAGDTWGDFCGGCKETEVEEE